MTEQDYIRKAVELADRWELHGTDCFSTPDSGNDSALDVIENMTQMEKDALAAQLVRQVDRLDYNVCANKHGAEITHAGINGEWITGADRAMNTIMAIVDSGVLE